MSNGILQGAHHLVLNNAHFTDNSSHVEISQTNQTTHNIVYTGEQRYGIRRLLEASMPDAFHDSSARYPPPRCHVGTRRDIINTVTGWALDTSQHVERIFWMYGPAGVGKSAVAQSCADILASQHKLGAAFFFSRPNERNDSNCLFTSIAYQLATKSDLYGDILEHKIRKDPTLVAKSITEQFRELLVKPLQHPRTDRADIEEWTIIVDGLDECEGREAQSDIIEIVATSAREETTPFRWIFLSRPETHIVASFTRKRMRSLSRPLELPVSRKLDHEILCYLTYELRKIRKAHGLPRSWPTEQELGILVHLSAGLWIYAATVVRFVGERNSSGPVDQLRAVLSTAAHCQRRTDSEHPLSELDLFYVLIMRCIPSRVLPIIQKILLLLEYSNTLEGQGKFEHSTKIPTFANILSLSEPQFRNACGYLHSVLSLDSNLQIRFYHASFMDFLQDPGRSKEFCIYSSLDSLRRELIERLNTVHARSTLDSTEGLIRIDVTWPGFEGFDESWIYRRLIEIIFGLCQWRHTLDSATSAALLNLEFHLVRCLWKSLGFYDFNLSPERLRQNIPREFRNRIVRRAYNPAIYWNKPADVSWCDVYTLGRGKNRAVCWRTRRGTFWELTPYPSIFNFP